MPCTVHNIAGFAHKTSGGMSMVFPDVCKTPAPPAPPVPIPYPNIGKSSDTIAGTTTVKAIHSGALYGFGGLVDRMVEVLSRQLTPDQEQAIEELLSQH